MSNTLLPGNWLAQPIQTLAHLAPLQTVEWPPFCANGLHLSIKREDLLGAQLGGNKLYKLYGHLKRAMELFHPLPGLASFGGAWSNHLYALAGVAQQLDLPALAIVRGEKPPQPSAMLRDLLALGVRVEYVSRTEFRELKLLAQREETASLNKRFGEYYWIPEGGGGAVGAAYCSALREAILQKSERSVDVIAHACGTGTTLAGLLCGPGEKPHILGVAVLKAADAIAAEVRELTVRLACPGQVNWEVDRHSHCGGYAKLPAYLLDFMQRFETASGILLDPVYTAKLMYGLTRMAEAGKWKKGTHIVAVHSGGLQGRRGWQCFQQPTRGAEIY